MIDRSSAPIRRGIQRALLSSLIVMLLTGCSVSSIPGRGQSSTPTGGELKPTATPIPPMPIVTPTPVTPVAGVNGTATAGVEQNPTTYIVAEGDSLYAIALKFGVELSALIEANGLRDPNDIQVGQELKIPPKP